MVVENAVPHFPFTIALTPYSLQYLGARAPEAVKKKVLEMVYSWTVRLPDETKIADAYQMLKKQGERYRVSNVTRQKTLTLLEVSHFLHGYMHGVLFHILAIQWFMCFFSSHVSLIMCFGSC